MRLTTVLASLALAFAAPALAQAPEAVPPPPPTAGLSLPPLPPPLPEPGAFLAPGPGRTVRLRVETSMVGARLIDLGRNLEVCRGACNAPVSAEPTQRYLLRSDVEPDSESFSLSQFTRAVVVHYVGVNEPMRKAGLGLLIGGGALLGVSALVWVVAFFWGILTIFSSSRALDAYARIMAPVTAVTASVGAAALATGAVLRILGGNTKLELRDDPASGP